MVPSFVMLLALLRLTTVAKGEVITSQRELGWKKWKSQYNKIYETKTQEATRRNIWMNNMKFIKGSNFRNPTMHLRMNQYGDLSSEEFNRYFNNYVASRKRFVGSTFLSPINLAIPDSVNWTQSGYVTPVKNQGKCGSCWAFSSTGSLEGQHFKKTGNLVELSQQNLIDCSLEYGNMGCYGGLVDFAFKYIKSNNGIDTASSYPYIGKVHPRCLYNASSKGASLIGFIDVTSGSEDQLEIASATIGPISVAIDASKPSFQFYHSGIYDEPKCYKREDLLNHAVLLVGYGREDSNDYWLVKNSYGVEWGMDGYIKMSRNKNNQCGIATQASYPLV